MNTRFQFATPRLLFPLSADSSADSKSPANSISRPTRKTLQPLSSPVRQYLSANSADWRAVSVRQFVPSPIREGTGELSARRTQRRTSGNRVTAVTGTGWHLDKGLQRPATTGRAQIRGNGPVFEAVFRRESE
jgi:hypothetical protein